MKQEAPTSTRRSRVSGGGSLGGKKEEYREIKSYYRTRLYHAIAPEYRSVDIKEFDDALRERPSQFRYVPIYVIFRNGRSTDSPEFCAKCWLEICNGKYTWGAEAGKEYYVLHVEEIYTEFAHGIGQTDGKNYFGWITQGREGHILLFDPRNGNKWICGEIVESVNKCGLKEFPYFFDKQWHTRNTSYAIL